MIRLCRWLRGRQDASSLHRPAPTDPWTAAVTLATAATTPGGPDRPLVAQLLAETAETDLAETVVLALMLVRLGTDIARGIALDVARTRAADPPDVPR